ncbi:hypothetical protein EKL30_13840 [Candidimonas sp. SYP-B2681]|uniref:hypothetical protein n=1 Tax=Candidimonas sp. SYP-B2681 TaxID=2497686 RepID=UPI000F880CAE|nr:hypothetical protein [Candidimonas sp. SYP-B2681]RTZ41638.1 hypothetical protein EKL30_13840 [Candidimonas sp. SYP-B2681]
MKRNLIALSGVFLCAGLAACGTPKDAQELTQKTIQYRCGASGQQRLAVQYTFQGAEALNAKVVYNKQSLDLARDNSSTADMVGNTFRGSGFTWTTDKLTPENASTVHGNTLTQEAPKVINGQKVVVNNILAKDCKVVS